jgi:membrane protease YdiL (CAAX protease family)
MAAFTSVSERVRPRRPRAPWPPTAERQGIDLSPVAVVLAVGGATFLCYLLIGSAPKGQGAGAYAYWLVTRELVQLVGWLCVIAGLGWWRAAGLGPGSFSPWGAVPVLALVVASIAAAGTSEAVGVGPGVQLAVGAGVFLGALREEVEFRGFLYHGLTARLGGTTAVLAASALFSVYHIPAMVRDGVLGGDVLIVLVAHFGFGMYMCLIRARTGSILLPTILHTLWNLVAWDLAIWAYPEGRSPDSVASIKAAVIGVGLLLAYFLYLRTTLARSTRSLLTRPAAAGRGLPLWSELRSMWTAIVRPPSPEVFERFTDGARRAVMLAEEEARADGANVVGSEHLLLALIHERNEVTTGALGASGISLGSPARLEDLVGTRADRVPTVPLDKPAGISLRLAALEADAWEDEHIDLEHLLLGVTALRRSASVRMLRRQGFDPGHLRRDTADRMERRGWSSAPSQPEAASC